MLKLATQAPFHLLSQPLLFTDGEMKIQKGIQTCPKPLSQENFSSLLTPCHPSSTELASLRNNVYKLAM